MGMEKLRITKEKKSWIQQMQIPPRKPQSNHSINSLGADSVNPAIFPQSRNKALIHRRDNPSTEIAQNSLSLTSFHGEI